MNKIDKLKTKLISKNNIKDKTKKIETSIKTLKTKIKKKESNINKTIISNNQTKKYIKKMVQ